jgi:hypothetical protein
VPQPVPIRMPCTCLQDALGTVPGVATLVVPTRFNGPRLSGNGGWTAGTLAALLDPPAGACVTVRLRQPPPLEEEMDVVRDGGLVSAVRADGSGTVLEASVTDCDEHPGLAVVPRVDDDTAVAVAAHYRGAENHPFPTCFTCGPDRPAGDGLHLTPGVLPGRPNDTACAWTPAQDADPPTVWAALDCPGGWSVDMLGRPMVLGTITATVDRLPRSGETCVVMGRALDLQGRRAHTATTLWSGNEVLGRATAVWIAVDPTMFNDA